MRYYRRIYFEPRICANLHEEWLTDRRGWTRIDKNFTEKLFCYITDNPGKDFISHIQNR